MLQKWGMGMGNLEKRILQGEQEAFKEWIRLHIRKIERFARQYGASLEEASTVAENVFRNIYESLEDVTGNHLKESSLFINAIKELDGRQTADISGGLFSFEEDNELHRRLVALPKECRVPFILVRFHKKTMKEIAEITGLTEQQANQAVNEAYSILDEYELEKKLEFLSKSYERLSPYYNETNIFHSKVEEILPVEQTSKTDKSKRPFLFWGIGAGLLLGLLSIITYTNSNAYQEKSAEKFMEMARVSFQEELERNLQLAGLPAPEFLRRDIYGEKYGEDTRRKFDWFIADLGDQLERDGRIDKKEAKTDFESLKHELMAPSEMAAELSENPLVNDEEKSMDFVNEYIQKMSTLMRSYMYIVAQNENLIRESGRNDEGGYDLEAFYAEKSSYPDAFQHALDGMEFQGFVLKNAMSMQAEYVDVYPNIGTPELSKALQENLHPDTGIYITVLMGDQIDIHNHSVDEQTDLLFQIEKGLFQAKGYQELYSVVFDTYNSMIYLLTGLGGHFEIYDPTGTIKEEYKEAWTRIASNGENSPAAQIMSEVIIEMEESDWTTSDYLERLQYFSIQSEVKRILSEIEK